MGATRVYTNATRLSDRAFTCWQKADEQTDPGPRDLWENAALHYVTAVLAAIKSEMLEDALLE